MAQSDWTDSELEAAVEAYRRMQWLSVAGAVYNKSAFFRAYKAGPLAGRSQGSFDRRMRNISYLLDKGPASRGEETNSLSSDGYLPNENVGRNIEPRLRSLLEVSARKLYPALQICDRLGIDKTLVTDMRQEGSTIGAELYEETCRRLGLSDNRLEHSSFGKKQGLAARIMADGGIEPQGDCFSPSGDTVTAHGLRLVHAAIDTRLALQPALHSNNGQPTTGVELPPEPLVITTSREKRESESFTGERKTKTQHGIRRESELVDSYCEFLESKGLTPKRKRITIPGKRPLFNDIWVEEQGHLIEAKGQASREAIRMALGQLIDYGRFIGEVEGMAVLIPKKPEDDLLELALAGNAFCVWPSGKGFRDNAAGRFC
jgi:hypothetical protein